MRILVTGAAGMLGSALVPELASVGHDVQPTDIDLRNTRPWSRVAPTVREMTKLDVRSRADIDGAVENFAPELIVHLAAETDALVRAGDVNASLIDRERCIDEVVANAQRDA